MEKLVLYLSEEEIRKIVRDTAKRISDDYKDKRLVLIGALKGSFVFMADIMRCLSIPVEVDFIRVYSYGDSDVSSGKIELTKDIETDIKDKDVIIVEDIVDTGLTLRYLVEYLRLKKPKSVKTCALLDKPKCRRTEIAIDYCGRNDASGFLVGYGLDYAERYRSLPAIYDVNL